MNKIKALLVLLYMTNFVLVASADSTLQLLTSQLCNIVNGVRAVVGIIALVLFLIGGLLYAGGHFMPQAGSLRGNAQGWAMGMIIGGIVGLILVIVAPFIIATVAGFGSITNYSC